MSTIVKQLISAAGAITATAVILISTSALAGPENLVCRAPFNKIQTNSNSIVCKKGRTFDTRADAITRKNILKSVAACNAGWSKPKSRVWRKADGKWGVRVWFVCAAIS